MQARIKAIRWEAEDILSFILEPLGGGLMPAFEPGAHIDVQLAPGLSRSYSLANDPAIRGSLRNRRPSLADQPGRFAPYP
jgi:vanillate O-demethylase ferredoxin subunit